jgi:hypothetical protein
MIFLRNYPILTEWSFAEVRNASGGCIEIIILLKFDRILIEIFIFYLPHMEYDEKYWFRDEKNEWKKKIADFHVLGLFMAKKHDLSDKKVFRRCRCRTQNLHFTYRLGLKC